MKAYFYSMKNILIGFMLIPLISWSQTQRGLASFYSDQFQGKKTASGQVYRKDKYTAAHKTLPFGTRVQITNLSNQKVVKVTINDRGPYVDDRIIDLSRAAAVALDFVFDGLTEVELKVVDSGDGSLSTQPVEGLSVQNTDKRLYRLSVHRAKLSGYGIQIGTYQDLANLIDLTSSLKARYQNKTWVEIKKVNRQTYYSLLLGQYRKPRKADALLRRVRKSFPDAFRIRYNPH